MGQIIKPPSFTWLELPDLPKVPDHFVQRAKDLVNQNNSDPLRKDLFTNSQVQHDFYNSRHRTIIKDNQEFNTSMQIAYSLGDDWIEWVKTNITNTFYDASVRTLGMFDEDKNNERPIRFGPHTDGQKLRLFYLVEQGSDDVATNFYVKPGSPMVLDLTSEMDVRYENNEDELVLLEKTKFPLNTWIVINSYVLHSVENGAVGKRINFSITIPADSITYQVKFKNEHS